MIEKYWGGWGWSQSECGLIDHGTLKSGVSHKWFDELSRFFERFLHVDSGGIIFGFTTNLHIWNPGRPLQLYIAGVFRKKSLWAKMTPKWVFSLFWKILSLIFAGNVLNKNWYCSEFDLTDCDLGFITRFWISTIELFFIMSSFSKK